MGKLKLKLKAVKGIEEIAREELHQANPSTENTCSEQIFETLKKIELGQLSGIQDQYDHFKYVIILISSRIFIHYAKLNDGDILVAYVWKLANLEGQILDNLKRLSAANPKVSGQVEDALIAAGQNRPFMNVFVRPDGDIEFPFGYVKIHCRRRLGYEFILDIIDFNVP